GKSSPTNRLPPADPIAVAVNRGASVEELAPLVVALSADAQSQLFTQLERHLPGASWDSHDGLTPVTGAVATYLDSLFEWASRRGDIELCRKCLEARYGMVHEAVSPFTQLDEIRDLYTRLVSLDGPTRNKLVDTHTAIPGLGHRQVTHSLEQVLHGLELLRSHLGTAADYTQLGAEGVAGPARDGIHVIRISLKLPDQKDLAVNNAPPFGPFLKSVADYNAAHPQAPVHIDLLLDPVMKEYGMGFAQINAQRTVGKKGGERAKTDVDRFRLEGEYLLHRHAKASGTTPPLDLMVALDDLDATKATLAPAEWTSYLKTLQQRIVDATVPLESDRATTTKQWDHQTYADVGKLFGTDCKRVRDAVQANHPGVVTSIELGNEPQAEWALHDASVFPGKPEGRADLIAQFLETTEAAMAVVGKSANGPVILNAAAQWDPATEKELLANVIAYENKHPGHTDDLKTEIVNSQFYMRMKAYIEYWTAKNPGDHKMPLSIHLYNSPALDAALLSVLSDLAGNYKIQLELYVTEFQVDADAGTNAGNDGQTTGILAAGIDTELAPHPNVTIVSMLAWSYTDVKKTGKHYDLQHDPAIKPLFG
ncbi:MAG TPA: hypothetical protein VGO00_24565, partial [Kofleriaceae bacterium]|nr:hypothetical protein [Kofleriaceae bacterium]